MGDIIERQREIVAKHIRGRERARLGGRAGHESITAPDKPYARPVLGRIRVLDGKPQLALAQLLDNILRDLVGGLGAGLPRLRRDLQRVAIELGIEREPSAADCLHLKISRVQPVQRPAVIAARQRLVGSKLAFISPLIGMDVVPP